MNRITIKHEKTESTQTDLAFKDFLGTQISTPGGNIYHVSMMVTSNINLVVGEHLSEKEAQEQVDRIWCQVNELRRYMTSDEYLAQRLMERQHRWQK